MTDQISIPPSFSVDLMSDLHVDKWNGAAFDYAAHKKSDIAVIAGDVADGSVITIAELEKIAAVYKTVLFVDGNHEFRKCEKTYNFDFEAVEKELRDGIAKLPNVIYLRDQSFVKDGVAIIGRNGHWDYKIAECTTKDACIAKKDAITNAAKAFKSTFNEAASFVKMAERDYDALRKQVIAFNQDPSIHTIVVVTHTVPRKELMPVWPAWQARGGSSLMRNLQKHDAHNKIKDWFCGHSHTLIDQEIDGVRYRQNSRGGIKEGRTDFKQAAVTFRAP